MSTVANKSDTRNHDARRRNARDLVLAAVLAVAILLLLVNCDPRGGASGAAAGTGGADLHESVTSFTVEGNTRESISPGVRAPLDLKLTNLYHASMSVTGLTVTVQTVNAPNADKVHPCTVGDFAVYQASSTLEVTIAAHSTSTLSDLGVAPANRPHVGMLERSVNQDGCKGASLTLGYSSSGTLAQR